MPQSERVHLVSSLWPILNPCWRHMVDSPPDCGEEFTLYSKALLALHVSLLMQKRDDIRVRHFFWFRLELPDGFLVSKSSSDLHPALSRTKITAIWKIALCKLLHSAYSKFSIWKFSIWKDRLRHSFHPPKISIGAFAVETILIMIINCLCAQ